jgi:hypothetical protein
LWIFKTQRNVVFVERSCELKSAAAKTGLLQAWKQTTQMMIMMTMMMKMAFSVTGMKQGGSDVLIDDSH